MQIEKSLVKLRKLGEILGIYKIITYICGIS